MGSSASDRNLLFGILAWQNGVIHKNQLLEGMKAWTFAKDRTLAEVLVSQQVLTHDRATRLQRMVDDQIALHDNDPQQSLIALSSVADVARSLAAIADEQLQTSIAFLAPDDPNAAAPTLGSVGTGTSQGRFKILRPHAQGGLGQVSIARDAELNRDVALKEIRTGQAFDPQLQSRFLLEAEITGGLEHPGIVPVYGLGNYEDGRPYYAMRFIRGQSLEQAIRDYHGKSTPEAQRNLEFRGLLKRFVDVCEAMSYAHSRGVLHRDLKPGNIMLGKYGETLVVDWGLAKATGDVQAETGGATLDLDEEGSLVPLSGSSVDQTMAGSAIGTPAYMSPEQAAGRIEKLGPATDVFAMGATLYHILTGQTPHAGKSVADVLAAVIAGRLIPPREIDRKVPRNLEAVCLMAMATDPADRYPSVADLASDIERALADEPVRAYPEPIVVRARRWGRRHSTVVATSCVVVLLTVVGLVAFSSVVANANQSLAAQRARLRVKNSELTKANASERKATAKAKAQQVIAGQRRQEARQLTYASDMRLAFSMRRDSDAAAASSLLQRHRPNGDADLRGTEWYVLNAAVEMDFEIVAKHQGHVTSLQLSSANGQQRLYSAGLDGHLKAWDLQSGESVLDKEVATSGIQSIGVAPHGTEATLGASGGVRATFGVQKLKLPSANSVFSLVPKHSHNTSVESIAYAANGDWYATGPRYKEVTLTHNTTGKKYTLPDCDTRNRSIAFSSDSQFCAAAADLGANDGPFKVFSLTAEGPNEQWALRAPGSGVAHVCAFMPGSHELATACRSRLVVPFFDVDSGQIVRTADTGTFRRSSALFNTLAFSPNGRYLVAGDDSGRLFIWEPKRSESRIFNPVAAPQAHQQPITSIAVTDEGDVFSGSEDGNVVLSRPTSSGCELHKIRGVVNAANFDAAGGQFLLACEDGTVRTHKLDLAAIKPGRTLEFGLGDVILDVGEPIDAAALSPSGRVLAIGTNAGTLAVYDLESKKLTRFGEARDDGIQHMAYSTDGALLASCDGDGHVEVWETSSANRLWTARPHKTGQCMTFVGSDKALIVAGREVLDAKTGEVVRTIEKADRAWASSSCPIGDKVASAQPNGYLLLLDGRADTVQHVVPGLGSLQAVDFSIDGKTVVAVSHEGDMLLADAVTGSRIGTLRLPHCPRHFLSVRVEENFVYVFGSFDKANNAKRDPDSRLLLWKCGGE